MPFRILDSGDTAFTVEFGDQVDRSLLAAVAALDDALMRAVREGGLQGLVETVPTFRSLTVIYDPLLTSRAQIEPAVRALLASCADVPPPVGRHWALPVCYGNACAEFGPDLQALAAACGLSVDEVVRLHSSITYGVYMLGFLPGFPFMGDLPHMLSQPRRSTPRVRVPAGSVATAGTLTAIYPWESPGGWHLLGLCPVPLFSAAWPQAALLLPGDQVRFRPVGLDEYREIELALAGAQHLSAPPLSFLAADEVIR